MSQELYAHPCTPQVDSHAHELLAEDHVVRGEIGLLPEGPAAEVQVVRVRQAVEEVILRRNPEVLAGLLH